MGSVKETLFNPIFNDNPIGLQILGICSALAVTSKMSVALVMCLALTFVCAFSNLFISIIEPHPEQHSNHCADDHYCFTGHRCGSDYCSSSDMRRHRFVGLIITNCIGWGGQKPSPCRTRPV